MPKTCPFKEGDLVGYKSCLEDPDFTHVGRVYAVYEEGIPSHPEPMIKIEGKAGVIDPDHCTRIPTAKEPGQRLMAALAALEDPEGLLAGINPGPEADELQAAYAEMLAQEVKAP